MLCTYLSNISIYPTVTIISIKKFIIKRFVKFKVSNIFITNILYFYRKRTKGLFLYFSLKKSPSYLIVGLKYSNSILLKLLKILTDKFDYSLTLELLDSQSLSETVLLIRPSLLPTKDRILPGISGVYTPGWLPEVNRICERGSGRVLTAGYFILNTSIVSVQFYIFLFQWHRSSAL